MTTPTMTRDDVMTLMQSSQSNDDWNANTRKVKAAFGGQYPEFWYEDFIASGLTKSIPARWGNQEGGQIKVTSFDRTTIEQALATQLYNMGLFEEQAEAIIAKAKAHETFKAMADHWNTPAASHPPAFMAVLLVSIKPIALAWIDENIPRHWARPMFCPDTEAELKRLETEPPGPPA